MKVRIVKVNGEPVTYREALLRFLPEWVMSICSSAALMIAAFSVTDAQYFAVPTVMQRIHFIKSETPSWYGAMQLATNIWICSEFIVLLTNKKRRAIHDFIAQTVVIRDAQQGAPTDAP